MVQGTWSWIVPDGLWEIAKPLLPPLRVRPQGGGTPDTPDETLFAAIIYVLVSGCAWRQLPPCFGISKSARRLICARPGWGGVREGGNGRGQHGAGGQDGDAAQRGGLGS